MRSKFVRINKCLERIAAQARARYREPMIALPTMDAA
jgi:hypothetical protein